MKLVFAIGFRSFHMLGNSVDTQKQKDSIALRFSSPKILSIAIFLKVDMMRDSH